MDEDPVHPDVPFSYSNIYVNRLAESVIRESSNRIFPVGSIIVREKLSNSDATKPDLFVVMIKRAAGTLPSSNDWQYLTFNFLGVAIKGDDTASCINCHQKAQANDFVFVVHESFSPKQVEPSQEFLDQFKKK